MKTLRSNAWIEGPGTYRELGADDRKNSVLVAPLNSFMVPSYDPNQKSSRVSNSLVLIFERMEPVKVLHMAL